MKTRSRKKHGGQICIMAILMLFLIGQVYPIIWLFISSIKPAVEFSNNPFSLPITPTLKNYYRVIYESNMFSYVKNNVIVTGCAIVFIVGLSATVGFALEKFAFEKINARLELLFTIGILIPVQVTLIPLFIYYSNLNVLDTYPGLILPQIGFGLPMSVMLFKSFYSYVPNELIEAGIIDGCSIYRVFGQIIFPMSKNTVVTIVTTYTIFIWNDFIFANTFTRSNNMKTTGVGLQDFIGAYGSTDWGAIFAAVCVTILPILLLYFVMNKQVLSGVSQGAVKG